MIGIRQIDVRGINQEHRFDVSFQSSFHHPYGHSRILHASCRIESFLGYSPLLGAPRPVLVVVQSDVEWQPPGQATSEPFAHGIRLAGLRMRPATGSSDVSGKGEEIDQTHGIVLTMQVLVVPDSPNGKNASGSALSS